MKKIRLLTTLDKLDHLHRLVDKRKSVHINAQDLTNLLIDHSTLCRILTEHGVNVTEHLPRNRPKFDG